MHTCISTIAASTVVSQLLSPYASVSRGVDKRRTVLELPLDVRMTVLQISASPHLSINALERLNSEIRGRLSVTWLQSHLT